MTDTQRLKIILCIFLPNTPRILCPSKRLKEGILKHMTRSIVKINSDTIFTEKSHQYSYYINKRNKQDGDDNKSKTIK